MGKCTKYNLNCNALVTTILKNSQPSLNNKRKSYSSLSKLLKKQAVETSGKLLHRSTSHTLFYFVEHCRTHTVLSVNHHKLAAKAKHFTDRLQNNGEIEERSL